MAENTIKVRQKQRYDTEANWKSKNPVLLAGEIAISSDKNGLMKVGDGKSIWTAIPYSKASLSKTDVTTALGYTPPTTNTTYSIGTSSTAGIVKLYTGTGSNTDGSMTQAAIKSALDGKSGTGHTHSYLPLSGGTVTGDIGMTVGTASDRGIYITNTVTGKKVGLQVGSGTHNRGLYDFNGNKWMVFADKDDKLLLELLQVLLIV